MIPAASAARPSTRSAARAHAFPKLGAALAIAVSAASAPAVVLSAPIAIAAGTVNATSVEPRAPECRPGAAKPNATIWDKAKNPALEQYCTTLRDAFAKIGAGSFKTAIGMADTAEALSPGHAGPWLVRGSANARWGKDKDAIGAFEKAKEIDLHALDHARTLDDYASVLVRLGRLAEARKVYRALLPRSAGLCESVSVCPEVSVAFLAAGVLAMSAGPEGLPESIAILREARGKSDPKGDVHRVATLALALALDRNGDAEQARSIAEELVKARGVPTDAPWELSARLPSSVEIQAIRAIGYEVDDPAAALAAWRSFLAGGGEKGPWAAHAKQHVARLEQPGAKPKPKKPQ